MNSFVIHWNCIEGCQWNYLENSTLRSPNENLLDTYYLNGFSSRFAEKSPLSHFGESCKFLYATGTSAEEKYEEPCLFIAP